MSILSWLGEITPLGGLTLWLVVAALMIVAEIVTLGLTSIWFAGGAVCAGLSSVLGAPAVLQLVIFAIVSLALLFFMRPLAKKRFMTDTVKTNVDSLIGMQGIVTETINNLEGKGVVKLNGLSWTARSLLENEIPVGTTVSVEKIEGVKLIVSAETRNPLL